jgi:hypothetical protein
MTQTRFPLSVKWTLVSMKQTSISQTLLAMASAAVFRENILSKLAYLYDSQAVSGQEKLSAKFKVVKVINLEFGLSDPQGRPDTKT